MCEKVIQTHWGNQILEQPECEELGLCLEEWGLCRQDGIQLGLENKAEFNQMKKSKKAFEKSVCANQDHGGSLKWRAAGTEEQWKERRGWHEAIASSQGDRT